MDKGYGVRDLPAEASKTKNHQTPWLVWQGEMALLKLRDQPFPNLIARKIGWHREDNLRSV